jgi:hypothetical protein
MLFLPNGRGDTFSRSYIKCGKTHSDVFSGTHLVPFKTLLVSKYWNSVRFCWLEFAYGQVESKEGWKSTGRFEMHNVSISQFSRMRKMFLPFISSYLTFSDIL